MPDNEVVIGPFIQNTKTSNNSAMIIIIFFKLYPCIIIPYLSLK